MIAARVAVLAGDTTANRHLFDVCTRRWSPRARVRIDPDRAHTYATTMAVPSRPPGFPWAIYLAGADHRYRLVAFDLDSGRHGPETARTDADRLAAHLAELGVAHLRTRSGPGGGQHIWVRLAAPGAAPDEVRRLAHALRQHYPSLDTAPLTNPATGAVRPPGAPHRRGGQSLPHLTGAALEAALAGLDTETVPEVVAWLLARHPHSPAPAPHRSPTGPVRIVDPADPRLDRPRRALTDTTRALLEAAPTPGADRSAIVHSIFLGMARAGHSLADARAAAATAPGLVRLREDHARGREDTDRQWRRALDTAAHFAPAPPTARAPVDDELDRIEAAIGADPAHWARPGGASDERILYALVALARTARTRTLDIDCRRLAQAAAVDASTVSRRLRVLTRQSWVTRIRAGSGTRAATWHLELPPVVAPLPAATQGEPAPAPGHSSALLDHHTHDLWAYRSGLGAVAARIHWAVISGKPLISGRGRTPVEVAARTGYSLATVTRTLSTLTRLGVPTRAAAETSELRERLDRAADRVGVLGVGAQRVRRHLLDRELHRWWLEEQDWRRRRGKKTGVPRTVSLTLALPLEAPARLRYGRFPVTDTGRADYRAARVVVTRLRFPVGTAPMESGQHNQAA
ncbi:hypothetical protein RR21198_3556 [Rhodococcus rhodochrous ATCC 21198]|uniref:HTH iclR-type domain-containing protein n=1 Tax=Rhodococcus ruber TaxID=1830 RepID=A0A098BGX2_9NOCA|nr:hypothetical protein RR21198_3556 [Rhodococcus rhodochrous ATCC 21198]CDZ87495.1 conserved hypothetical protein [Rhodococcus ruber]